MKAAPFTIAASDIIADDDSQFDYRSFIGSAASGDVWEGSVGPGDQGNRRFTYQGDEQALETVFFDNLQTNYPTDGSGDYHPEKLSLAGGSLRML